MKHIAVVLFLMSYCPSSAKAQNSNGDFRDTISEFFTYLERGEYGEAVDYIYQDNPWIASHRDAIQNVRTTMTGLPGLVGNYRGNHKLTEADLASKLVRIDYIVLFDRQPLRFEFQFYDNGEGWMTYKFSFQEDLGDWLEERAVDNYRRALR